MRSLVGADFAAIVDVGFDEGAVEHLHRREAAVPDASVVADHPRGGEDLHVGITLSWKRAPLHQRIIHLLTSRSQRSDQRGLACPIFGEQADELPDLADSLPP